jgi:ribosome biogenesis protein Nip4
MYSEKVNNTNVNNIRTQIQKKKEKDHTFREVLQA